MKEKEQTFYIDCHLFQGSTRAPTDLEFECIAKALGTGTHLLVDKTSGVKKLILNINDKVRILNTLDEIDEYDGDDYYEEEEDWDGLGMGSSLSPDTITEEYKGDAIISDEAVYLCPPKFDRGDVQEITIDS